jgi:MEMO1 family protein
MNKKILVLLCLLAAAFLAGYVLLFLPLDKKPVKAESQSDGIFTIKIADKEKFLSSIAKFNLAGIECPAYFLGISPHHLLASDLIAELFANLLQPKTKTIILIGPNHFEVGKANALSSQYAWQTQEGTLEPDLEIIKEMKEAGLIQIDNRAVSGDHSIFGLVPYIKHYAPQAKIVPIILKHNYSLAEIKKLAEYLQKYQGRGEVVVAGSIDFSHYLDGKLAEKKDQETAALIKNPDYYKIMELGNDHVDCPACLSLILMLNDANKKAAPKILQNTNSGELLDNLGGNTTSYFTILFP